MKFNVALVLLASSVVANTAVINFPTQLSRRASINLSGLGRGWGGTGGDSSDSDTDSDAHTGIVCGDDGWIIHHKMVGCKKGADGNGTPVDGYWTEQSDWCWLAKTSDDTNRLKCTSLSGNDELTDEFTCLSTSVGKQGGCGSSG